MKRSKITALLLTIAMVLSMGLTQAVAAQASGGQVEVSLTVTYGQTEARTMLDMINDFRTGEDAWALNQNGEKEQYTGLGTLAYDYDLEKIAMQRAAETVIYNDHTRPNGESCFTATYNGTSPSGENIAAGYGLNETAADVFEGWQETDEPYEYQGHRRNMLNRRFTRIGIGHVVYNGVHYWTQEFGTGRANETETTSTDDSVAVSISVATSFIDSATSAALKIVGNTEYELNIGAAMDAPAVNMEASLAETWPTNWKWSAAVVPSWTSSDTSVVSVSDGRFTAAKAGEAILTASCAGKSASITVKVKDTEPVVTAEPVTPTDPVVTTEPETSTEPATPAEPTTPAGPETSAEPTTPAEPETSTEPTTPAEPETSTEPVTPAEPETSAEPVATEVPTVVPAEPTSEPVLVPTQAPTPEPTLAPTQAPTPDPTLVPTQAPTPEPIVAPTQAPAAVPTSAPAPSRPLIVGESAKEGWEAIKEDAANAFEGKWISVNMNGVSVVPGDVIDSIKGKNVTLAFDMGNGIIWCVNGRNVTTDHAAGVDFSAQTATSAIPQNIVEATAGSRQAIQLSLAYSGEFGYTATLMVNVNPANAGLYANLYFYNAGAGRLEYVCADQIDDYGITELKFTHASDYVIVIDEKDMGTNGTPSGDSNDAADTDDTADAKDDNSQDTSVRSPKTGEFDAASIGTSVQSEGRSQSLIWLLIAGVAVITVTGAVACLIKKRFED